VAEVDLLLAVPQVAALERAARQRGLTTAQLLRWIIQDFLNQPGKPPAR
jgi:hypothetical protein